MNSMERLAAFIDREAPELAPLIRLVAAADKRELDLIWTFARALIGKEVAV